MKIKLFGTVNDSIVDGPGLRYAIFAQGCPHHCEGCHNPKSHDFDGGYWKNISEILSDIDSNPLLDGVTFSGGEPFMQAEAFIELASEIRKRHLNIIVYSGFTYEEILCLGENQKQLLSLCDILVDGRFELSQRNISLLYKGSLNQRIIDVAKSLESHKVVEIEMNDSGELIIE